MVLRKYLYFIVSIQTALFRAAGEMLKPPLCELPGNPEPHCLQACNATDLVLEFFSFNV